MMKIIVIHVATLMLLFIPIKSKAFEYEVDMPNSGDPRYEAIRISIDGCNTYFKIPKKDLDSFVKAMLDRPLISQDMVKQAIKRRKNGCK
jgi:hypothetical protein